MKRILPLLFLSIVFFKGFSQADFRFADSTAEWNVLETQWCMTAPCIYFNTYIFKEKGDTTIGSYQYQKIEYNNSVVDFIRKDSTGKVFHKDNSGEYLIYNFGATVGDTFTITINQWANSAIVTVLSVDTIVMDKPRKRMLCCVDFWSIGCMPKKFVCIDGIGDINSHFLMPGLDQSFTDGPSYELLCYFQNNNLTYHDTLFDACRIDSTWHSIEKLSNSSFHLSPNPTTTFVTIQSENNFPSSTYLQLFDLTGRMVLQKQLTGETPHVELTDLSRGMYLYRVCSKMQQFSTGKLAIE